jgi:hypothetical protein
MPISGTANGISAGYIPPVDRRTRRQSAIDRARRDGARPVRIAGPAAEADKHRSPTLDVHLPRY